MALTDKQLERYSRQMVLSPIGGSGQEKLLASKVLVVGAGGLGSACLYYLASSGVGTLGIVDFDSVDLSNLHRQIIHGTSDVGKSKVLSVQEKINKLNPDVEILTFDVTLSKSNIESIFKGFEIIVDGLDNFADKFLVNDYSVFLGKKLVHGGVIKFEGQVLTVIPNQSACLRCYFVDNLPLDCTQSCKELGVFASCVGVLSTLQANEVLKLILGIGEPLTNRVLKFDALNSTFYEFKIKGQNSNCPTCSKCKVVSDKW